MVDGLIAAIQFLMGRSKDLSISARGYSDTAYDLLVIAWHKSGKISDQEATTWEEFRLNLKKK